MNDSQTPNSRDTKNNAEKSVELVNFEKIKSPDELLSFMKDNIKYGFVGKNNKKVYSYNDEKFDDDFLEEYSLQSPQELLSSKHGVCWDQAELERHWFLKQNKKHKVFYMMYVKDDVNSLPTHTFLTFEKDGKWCWFEHAFGNQQGIHEYDSLDDLLEDVKKKQFENAKKNRGAQEDDFKYLKVCEYENPRYGSDPNEFVTNIMENNLLKDKENGVAVKPDIQIIKKIFHVNLDSRALQLQEKINNKIKREGKIFDSKQDLALYLDDIFERLHNLDYIKNIFEIGDEEKIKEYVEYAEILEEKADLMEYFAKLRRETIEKSNLELAQRDIKNPDFDERDEVIGVYKEKIEPHVRETVYKFNKNGMKTVYSGFWEMEHQSIGFKDSYLKDFKFGDKFLNEMKNRGVVIRLEPNMIAFEVKKKFSLDELKNIWDEIGREILENINH